MMKAWRSLLIFVSLVFAASRPAFAQDKVGEATYVDGGVSLERDGQALDQSEVQTGLEIQNFDMVKTGADGLAEVNVDNPKAPAITIKVSPRTQFSFELASLESRQKASIGLLGGSISLKVGKLAGSQDLNVVMDNTVMGVRGTEFTVTSVPSGDVLVVCTRGDVVLTDESGKEVHAVPGSAVEKRAGEKLVTVPTGPGDPDGFRKKWEQERLEALKEHALDVIQREALTYDRLVDEFTNTYAALQEKRDLLARWEAEDKTGAGAANDKEEKEKAEIADLIADLRETQFLLERVHFRLLGLKDYHDQGLGDGEIRHGLTTTEFFERFEKDRAELEREMAKVRLVTKLVVHHDKGHDRTLVTDLKKFYEKRQAHLKKIQNKRLVKKTT